MIKNAIINAAGGVVKLHSPKRMGPFHQRAKSHLSNYGKLPAIVAGSGSSFGPLNTSNNNNLNNNDYLENSQ
jgi:hypothetical protein